jgi:serine/threonine-protein kinase
LALLVLVVAAAGLGSSSHSGSLPAATVAVARTDPASATPELNLDKPVPVAATPASGARENDIVRLRLSAGGLPLGSGQSTLTRSGGALQAEVNVSASRYLVAGRATGRVDLLRGGAVVAGRSFAVRSSRSPFMTLPALATAALVLFIGGYVESLSRTLRRRRARVGPTMGMVLLGAAFGVVGVGAAWVLVGREPSPASLAVCVVIGGGAGAAGAIASGRALPKRRRRP